MQIKGQFIYDSETQTMRLQPENVQMGDCFNFVIVPKISAQLGSWQTPSPPLIRLTFDKDGADFVCSDITNQ